jgi:hypothetical protein
MSVDHPKKMVNHVNATANHPRTNMNLLPVNMNQVMKNLIVMEDSFIMKIWMCIAIHHSLHLSNRPIAVQDWQLIVAAATTTMSYNVDQGVYVSSDKEEEETDKKDPGVNVSCM